MIRRRFVDENLRFVMNVCHLRGCEAYNALRAASNVWLSREQTTGHAENLQVSGRSKLLTTVFEHTY